MSHALLISVRFLNGRYHGEVDWPPAPARLFQALISGAASGTAITPEYRMSLLWLETLGAPLICAPAVRTGQERTIYVPNNDVDSVGGDFGRLAEIRTEKSVRARLFDALVPLLYLWYSSDAQWQTTQARTICSLAERLYQLGRGVDPAFASGEIISQKNVEDRLRAYSGKLHFPSDNDGELSLACPVSGSLKSLQARFLAGRFRFSDDPSEKSRKTRFTRAPRPRFRTISYNAPPTRLLYELRHTDNDTYDPWPLVNAAKLVETVRDGTIASFDKALGTDPDSLAFSSTDVDRYIKGVGAGESDKQKRLRFIPLPSIGHRHTDAGIRRLLVELPQEGPITEPAMKWALNGLPLGPGYDFETGEFIPHVRLIPAESHDMLRHYGVNGNSDFTRWRTVTPAALPNASRRRIDTEQQAVDVKGASARLRVESKGLEAVHRALRHAGIRTKVTSAKVQREPWSEKGVRAERFAGMSRFSTSGLWHVEIEFSKPLAGPVVIGDGRFLGLGLMAPVPAYRDILIFELDCKTVLDTRYRKQFLKAVRRALMSLASNRKKRLPRLFSGHESDGAAAQSGQHEHIFLATGVKGKHIDRFYVIAPWRVDGSFNVTERNRERADFDRVVSNLSIVRVGNLGVIDLREPRVPHEDDRVCGRGRVWTSATPYTPTRHPKGANIENAIAADVLRECKRRHLPRPDVKVRSVKVGPRGATKALLQLEFKVAIEGPLLLGRESHLGGGLFETLKS